MDCRFAFVILHYNSIDSTRKCIDSILQLQDLQEIGVVIVDNASPNQTGKVLENLYSDMKNIKVILLLDNLGFARGNNIGFKYARNVMKAECIICANNDVYFVQKDFLNYIKRIESMYQADVIGPDIQTYQEMHQNPLREKRLSMVQFRKKHVIKKIWLLYWRVCKCFPWIKVGEKIRTKVFRRNLEQRKYQKISRDIVLQGACILFMKRYIENEEEAFVPDTFMYMEEDILSYKCLLKGYYMLYCPELTVFHAESRSTVESFAQNVDKEIFYYQECLKSDQILLRYIKMAQSN